MPSYSRLTERALVNFHRLPSRAEFKAVFKDREHPCTGAFTSRAFQGSSQEYVFDVGPRRNNAMPVPLKWDVKGTRNMSNFILA